MGKWDCFAPVRDYIDTLVHPSAHQDALSRASSRLHRAAPARQPRRARRVPALSARARRAERARSHGVRLARRADPDRLFPVAHRPLRERAYAVVAGADRLVTRVAVTTGGIASFAAIWLVVVPLEAALSASRRVVAMASTFALARPASCCCLSALHAAAAGVPPSRAGARWPRSASSRPRSTRPGSRSAPNRWRAPASGCSMPRRTVTGCSPAT